MSFVSTPSGLGRRHVLGNTYNRHVVLELLVPCLLWTSSSSSTWYCQVHHSTSYVVCLSSLDMSKPTKTATAHNLVDRRNVYLMRRMSSFRMRSRLDTPSILRSILISVVAIFLLLVNFIARHSLPYVRAGLIMALWISLMDSSSNTI